MGALATDDNRPAMHLPGVQWPKGASSRTTKANHAIASSAPDRAPFCGKRRGAGTGL